MTASHMQTGVLVRLATADDDLDALNAGNSLWLGADEQRRLAAAMPAGARCDILVGELEGEPVGCAVALTAASAAFGYGMARVYVQPQRGGKAPAARCSSGPWQRCVPPNCRASWSPCPTTSQTGWPR